MIVRVLSPAMQMLPDDSAATEDGFGRPHAQWLLLHAYLRVGRGEEAEKLMPEVARRMDGSSPSYWLATIAKDAVRKGDSENAMRLWRQTANVDGTHLDEIRDLVAAGLADELRRFYSEWQSRDPESWVPAEALRILGQ